MPVTILLVDDRLSQLSFYENALRDLNEPLVKATSVHEALNHLRMFEVAIVLINTSRPGIDAIELAAAMRRQPLLQEIPIIFLSDTQESAVDQMLGYRSGAFDYISAPIEILQARVGIFVEICRKNRRLEDENQKLEDQATEHIEELRPLNVQLHERLAELESIMRLLPIGVAVAHDPKCEVILGNAALSETLYMISDNGSGISSQDVRHIF